MAIEARAKMDDFTRPEFALWQGTQRLVVAFATTPPIPRKRGVKLVGVASSPELSEKVAPPKLVYKASFSVSLMITSYLRIDQKVLHLTIACNTSSQNLLCDGLPDKGSGIPYFYLTTLDPTARYALKDQRSSFTVSEYPIGTCGKTDPENPTCSKITLTGKLKLGNPDEAEYAQTALFTKHPEMKDWPKDHNFQIFKLEVENIFMINWFGGPKPLTVDEYLHTKM
ncbi:unnamed protein product [Ilex paraguariensis]